MSNAIRSWFTKLFSIFNLFNRHPESRRSAKIGHHQEFVILGLGRFGSSVALTLHEQHHDVLAIDIDENLVQRYSNQLPHVVHMDITNREGLLELGIDNFDTGIVCVGSDFESNILATVLLRQLGVRRVILQSPDSHPTGYSPHHRC